MPLNKKNVFFIFSFSLCLLAMHQSQVTAAGGLEELSSFFDELFGDESPKKSPSPTKTKQPTAEMPTPAQLAELTKHIATLLSSVSSLISTTHPHHASWGGAVYESIKQHRNSLTVLESTLLHLQAIQSYLPKKELGQFVAALKKYSKDILDLIAAANAIPAAKLTTIAEENAFLLGETSSLPSRQTQKNLERRTNAFANLAKKIAPLNTELQKILHDPEFNKIFPEAPKPSDYKPSSSSSRSSSSSSSRSSSKKSSPRDSWDDDYDSRSPYSSNYSGYDDYDSFDRTSEEPKDIQEPAKSTDSSKEASGGTMAPPPKEKKDLPPEGFVEHVKFLQEDELVATLQRCLEGGSLLTNPSYFSTLAAVFEQLFAEHKDGGLSKLASQIKQLEKEAAQAHEKLVSTKKEEKKELPPGVMPESEEAKEIIEKEQKDRAALAEAQNDYQQLKQGVTSAVIRLRYLPTQHRVKESTAAKSAEHDGIRLAWMLPEHASGEDDDDTPKKHLGMNISSNIIDQEDVLCRHGRKTFTHFLDMFAKKFGMAAYIKTQEERLKQEIAQFEEQRRKKADMLSGNLLNTPLSIEHLASIQTNVEQLAALAYELQCEKPTMNTNDAHFYQLAQHKMYAKTKAVLTTEQKENLESGLGTSRYHITNCLSSLDQALQKVSTEIPAQDVEKLAQALTKAKTAWSGYITQEKMTRPKLPAAAEETEPQPPMLPLESVDDADEVMDEMYEKLSPAKKPKKKPIFQGISQDQLQNMLGAIAQPAKPQIKAR